MNKYLICITGLPGSGKTSIAKYLNKMLYISTFISIDQLKENIYDLIGFHCRKEKTSIRKLSRDMFLMLLEECMSRGDKVIITEYPFDTTWIQPLNNLQEKYSYTPITIQVFCSDISLNYHRMVDRDRNSGRHVAQCLKEYNPLYKDNYKSIEKWDYSYFKKFSENFSMLEIGDIIKVQNGIEPMENILNKTFNSIVKLIK